MSESTPTSSLIVLPWPSQQHRRLRVKAEHDAYIINLRTLSNSMLLCPVFPCFWTYWLSQNKQRKIRVRDQGFIYIILYLTRKRMYVVLIYYIPLKHICLKCSMKLPSTISKPWHSSRNETELKTSASPHETLVLKVFVNIRSMQWFNKLFYFSHYPVYKEKGRLNNLMS